MFNAAYAVGGPGCTQRTVEQLTGIRIDHFVVIDFNGFKQMVDALGGVPVCVPEEVNDNVGHIYLPAGSYDVSGDQALDYVRDGDMLIVWKLDRLGRSLQHLIETVATLEKRGVGFCSITEAIDTTTPGGRLVFHLFGALGQFEKDLWRT